MGGSHVTSSAPKDAPHVWSSLIGLPDYVLVVVMFLEFDPDQNITKRCLGLWYATKGKERMGASCKGICVRHKSKNPIPRHTYIQGDKRCQECQIYIKWNSHWCPCCGCRLRTKPRQPRGKKSFWKKFPIHRI
jgi:hypothetical protein